MENAPASLRVYTLAKRLPLFGGTDLLDVDGQLLAEMQLYASEEARVQQEEAARADRSTRSPGRAGKRVAGRRHR